MQMLVGVRFSAEARRQLIEEALAIHDVKFAPYYDDAFTPYQSRKKNSK